MTLDCPVERGGLLTEVERVGVLLLLPQQNCLRKK